MNEEKLSKLLKNILDDEEVFLNYLNSTFPLFHKSNFFARDLEYGIKSYLERKNIKISTSDAILLGELIGHKFEEKNYFKKVGAGVWTVNLPQYITTKPGDPF
jgi:hypothetical protein